MWHRSQPQLLFDRSACILSHTMGLDLIINRAVLTRWTHSRVHPQPGLHLVDPCWTPVNDGAGVCQQRTQAALLYTRCLGFLFMLPDLPLLMFPCSPTSSHHPTFQDTHQIQCQSCKRHISTTPSLRSLSLLRLLYLPHQLTAQERQAQGLEGGANCAIVFMTVTSS